MSIEYSLNYCKGWVFDEPTFNEFRNILEKSDDWFYDEFSDYYVHLINGWGGYKDGVFVGVYEYLGESSFYISIDQLTVLDNNLQNDILDFCKKISGHREVIEFLHNYPTNTFIINFCY
jgi:hypothetical protein